MPISVEIEGIPEQIERLNAVPSKVQSRIRQVLSQFGNEFVGHVEHKLSGGVLNEKTGKLRRSIKSQVKGDVLEVGSKGVPYAGIHEYGGTIHVPAMIPRNAKALQFANGEFSMTARAHTVSIPERSYMRSSADEMEPVYRLRVEEALEVLVPSL